MPHPSELAQARRRSSFLQALRDLEEDAKNNSHESLKVAGYLLRALHYLVPEVSEYLKPRKRGRRILVVNTSGGPRQEQEIEQTDSSIGNDEDMMQVEADLEQARGFAIIDRNKLWNPGSVTIKPGWDLAKKTASLEYGNWLDAEVPSRILIKLADEGRFGIVIAKMKVEDSFVFVAAQFTSKDRKIGVRVMHHYLYASGPTFKAPSANLRGGWKEFAKSEHVFLGPFNDGKPSTIARELRKVGQQAKTDGTG